MEPAVGRAKQSCASGQLQEDLNRPLFLGSCRLDCDLNDPGVLWWINHWSSSEL
jgi:hypothetical protein